MPTIEDDYPGLAENMDLIRGEVALQMGDSYSEEEFQNYARQHIQKWAGAQNKAGYSFQEINEVMGLRGNEKGQSLLEMLDPSEGWNLAGKKIAELPTWTGIPQAQAGFNRIVEAATQSVEKVSQMGGYGAEYNAKSRFRDLLKRGIDPRTGQPIDINNLSEQDQGELWAEFERIGRKAHRVGNTAGQLIPSPWGASPGEQYAKDMGEVKPSFMGGAPSEESDFSALESAGLNALTVGANVFDLTSIFGGSAKAAVKAERGVPKILSNVDVPAAPISRAAEMRALSETSPGLIKRPLVPQSSGLPLDPNANVLSALGDTPAKVNPSTNPVRGLPETSVRQSPVYQPATLPGGPSVKDLHGDLVQKLKMRADQSNGQIMPSHVAGVEKNISEAQLAPIRARAQEIKDVIRNSDPKKLAGMIKKLSPEVEKLPPDIKAEVLQDFEALMKKRMGIKDAPTDITAKTAAVKLDPNVDEAAQKFEADFQGLDKNALNEELGLIKTGDLGPKLTPESAKVIDEDIKASGGSIYEQGPDPELLKMLPDESVKPAKMPGAITDELDPSGLDQAVRGHYQNWLKKNKKTDSKESLSLFMSNRKRTTKGTDTRSKYQKAKDAAKKFKADEGGSAKWNTDKWEDVDDAAEGTLAKVPGNQVVDSTRYTNDLWGGGAGDEARSFESRVADFLEVRAPQDANNFPDSIKLNPAAFPDRLPMGDRQGEIVRPTNRFGEELDTGKMRERERIEQNATTADIIGAKTMGGDPATQMDRWRDLIKKSGVPRKDFASHNGAPAAEPPALSDLVKRFYDDEGGSALSADSILSKGGQAGFEATKQVLKAIRGNSYERAVRAELKGSTRLALSDAKKLFFENSHLPANERAMLAKDKFEAEVKFAIKEAKTKIKNIYPTLSDEGVNAAVHDYEIGLPSWKNIEEWSKAGRSLYPEKLGKIVQGLTTGTRKALTVYNPGIHLPNIVGDISFVADAGGNWAWLGKNSARINDIIMNPNNPLHDVFLKKGIIGSEMAQKPLPLELKKALDNEKDPHKLLMMMHDIEGRIGDTWVTGKLLNYPDQFMKTGLALQSSELGIRNGFNPLKRDIFQLDNGTPDWDRAARHVLDFTPSYDTIHPFINRTFGSTGAALMNHPFIKFPIENARIKKNVLMSRPVYSVMSRSGHAAMLAGIWGAAASAFHFSPDFSSGWGAVKDAYDREMKNPANKGKTLIPKPWRGDKGKIEFWDMTYMMPSGGIVKNIKQNGLVKGVKKEFMGGGLLNRESFENAETRTDSTALKIGKQLPAIRAGRDLYRGDRSLTEVLGLKTNRGGNPVIAGAKAAARKRALIIQDINAISDPTKNKLTPEEREDRRKKLLRELSQSVKGGGK